MLDSDSTGQVEKDLNKPPLENLENSTKDKIMKRIISKFVTYSSINQKVFILQSWLIPFQTKKNIFLYVNTIGMSYIQIKMLTFFTPFKFDYVYMIFWQTRLCVKNCGKL